MIDIMLDLETWGKKPGCDIRSIGATVFNRVTGVVGDADRPDKGQFYIAVDNPIIPADMTWSVHGEQFYTHWDATSQVWRKYPLKRDPQTVQWWSEQSDEAQAAFANPVDLKEGLKAFDRWLTDVAPEQRQQFDGRAISTVPLWAHGPAFDPPIFTAAYDAVGLPQPWHYRAPRDTRTILEAGGIDPHKGLEQFSTGIFHHALDDAQCQAAAVCAAFSRLRVSHDVVTHRDAWRRALMALIAANVGDTDAEYWRRELDAFDRVFADLANHPCLER